MVWILDACALVNEVIQFQFLFCFANLWVLINALEGLCYHPPCSCLCEVDPGWMVEGQATKGWNHDCLDSQMDGCHTNQGSLHFMLS